jgi:RNA polymerase sigma factor (sigma-70 family)
LGVVLRKPASADVCDSETLLIARIQARDVEAFEELFRLYRVRLARFLFKLVRRAEVVEEVTHDTLMVVWERAHTFKGESKLSTWVFAIAYRTAMKALRKQDEPVEDFLADQRASLDPNPQDDAVRSSTQFQLAKAISELSSEHRAVVEYTYFQEMGCREIAQIMNCPVDTVKTRMFHARRHLKRSLPGELWEWL